ncbi:MAG: hypothetical protein AB1629_04420 [Candidatus Omnitrophota bacterium]
MEKIVGKFPCPLCENKLEIKSDIKNRPYCYCPECDLKMFIKGDSGIRRLKEIINNDSFF